MHRLGVGGGGRVKTNEILERDREVLGKLINSNINRMKDYSIL